MTKPIIIAMLPLYATAMAAQERDYGLLKPWEARDLAAFMRAVGGRVRAAVTSTSRGFAGTEYESFPRLEAVACFGPYVQLIDLAEASRRGVAVSSTPDLTAEPVAELAMGLIVAALRRITEADRFVRAGRWPVEAFLSGPRSTASISASSVSAASAKHWHDARKLLA